MAQPQERILSLHFDRNITIEGDCWLLCPTGQSQSQDILELLGFCSEAAGLLPWHAGFLPRESRPGPFSASHMKRAALP